SNFTLFYVAAGQYSSYKLSYLLHLPAYIRDRDDNLSYLPHLTSFIKDRDDNLSYLPHLTSFIKDQANKLSYLPHLPAFIKDRDNKLSYLPHLPNRTYPLSNYTLFDITAPNSCQLHLSYKICTLTSINYTFFQ